MDVFKRLGQSSKQLQTVETFPWEILEFQEDFIEDFKKMAILNSQIKRANSSTKHLIKIFGLIWQ